MKLRWAKARHDTVDIPDAHIIAELHKESKKSQTREQSFIMPETYYEDYGYELPEDEARVIVIEF